MGYFEPAGELRPEDRDISRALASLREEVEAIDYYHQRAALTADQELKALLIHNRDEEIEHAAMCVEWLRRKIPAMDEALRTYLFTQAPVTQVEEAASGGAGRDGAPSKETSGSLGIGKL
ncbi:hypothetical protein TheveDRAFT_1807 [Thermanaerovibrio velox DSM 12556]|uniref:Ferritin n=1 Tax=Thermanaerovibrio velox DSM 12556 TaxID=926567 RepID=H0URF6_9BACT|nr:ferritin-like domain-containing protein [Thermanaerovibrio velox]EHM10925.1 hypothetical protein TheveDRAFT_1807 [Thermanaerovibrio velox DSM 12556]